MPGISQRSTQSFVQILGLPPSSSLFCDVQRYFPLVMVSLNRWTLFFSSSSQQDCELFIGILAALHSTRLKDKNWRNLSSAFSSWVSAPLICCFCSFCSVVHSKWSFLSRCYHCYGCRELILGELQFSSVQLLSCVRLFATPWTAARQASLSITNSRSPPKPMSIESAMPYNHLILCRPLLLLPSLSLSQHQSLFKWVSSSHQVAKVLEFQLQHQSFQWILLIPFRMDWLDLLAVQGTLKNLLQHHSSKASILWPSACFKVQLSHP